MELFVAYFRVSTQRQGASGLGLDAQRASVEAFVSRERGSVLAEYQDIESGKRNDRPGLQKALQRCRLTGARLLVAKLDRLSRNSAFLFALMESKVRFVCADMPEANELTVGMLALIADHERRMISERTKAALAAAKARGVTLGNPATLTNRDTTAATQERSRQAQGRNAEMLAVIQELRHEFGPMSLRETAKRLNNAGYTTARGKPFQANSVRRVIIGAM